MINISNLKQEAEPTNYLPNHMVIFNPSCSISLDKFLAAYGPEVLGAIGKKLQDISEQDVAAACQEMAKASGTLTN